MPANQAARPAAGPGRPFGCEQAERYRQMTAAGVFCLAGLG